MKKSSPLLFFLLITTICFTQENAIDSLTILIDQAKNDSTKVELMLDLSKNYYGSDPNKAIAISEQAKVLSESINYRSGVAYSFKNIGNGYYYLSDYVEAITHWQQAKLVFEEINDKVGIANMLSNMGAIYNDQGANSTALILYVESLKLAEEIKDSARIATVMQNIGALHDDNGDEDLALVAYMKALPVFESLNNANGIGVTSFNIGSIYTKQEKYDTALTYFLKSLKVLKTSPYRPMALGGLGTIYLKKGDFEEGRKYLNLSYKEAQELGNNLLISVSLNALAKAQEEHGEVDVAIDLYKKSIAAALQLSNANNELQEAYSGMMRLYDIKGNNVKGNEYRSLNEAVKDSIFSLESAKAQNRLLFNYEIEKKEGTIALLEKDNEIQKAKEEKQKFIKNGFVYGFLAMLIFASVFFIQRNKIKKGKKLSDNLLHNILPDGVAEELKEKGTAEAKDFELVSILFTDFKEFTKISEKLTAIELIREINHCFKAFDEICEKYGIEKIKTIGDSFMAAGGLPIPSDDSVKNTILAALEMQSFITERIAQQKAKNEIIFEMRLGIHSGPVVAGIVGVKKFQYDLWGDTVNTASRMESSGEIGKVNISQYTYDLVKDEKQFTFRKRGKIHVKGKGELEMYFVESSIT